MSFGQAHLYISYLHSSVTESDVIDHFSSKAKIAQVALRSGKIEGTKYGFVTLADKNLVSDALQLDQTKINGTAITVRPYKAKAPGDRTGQMNGGGSSVSQFKSGNMVVSVTHVHSEEEFYIQVQNEALHLNNIAAWMTTSASKARRMNQEDVTIGHIYGAPWNDGDFYRVRILQKRDNIYKVSFIDFGNIEDISSDNLIVLPREISNIFYLAHRCTLHNLLIIDKMQIKELLESFCGQAVEAQMYKENQLNWAIDLFMNGNSFCQDLVNRNLARYLDATINKDNTNTNGTSFTPRSSVSSQSRNREHSDTTVYNGKSTSDSHVPLPKPPLEKVENVAIPCTDKLEFFLQGLVPDSIDKLTRIAKLLPQLEKEATCTATSLPSLSDRMFVARFSLDNDLYRCKVVNPPGSGVPPRVTVCYIDYGNSEEVNSSSLIPIPPVSEAAKIPLLSRRCCIAGSKSFPELGDTTSLSPGKEKELEEQLQTLVNIPLKVKYYPGSEILEVEDIQADTIPSFRALLLEKNILKTLNQPDLQQLSQKYQKLHLDEKCKNLGGAQNMMIASVDTTNSYQGLIAHIDSLSNIFMQEVQNAAEVDIISHWMGSQEKLFNSIQVALDHSQLYGGIFREDNNYYRIKILEEKEKEVYAQFVDFGNSDNIDKNSLVNLPSNVINIPPLMRQCSINHLLITEDERKVVEYIKEKLLQKPAICLESNGKVTDLVLDEGNVSIVQLLVSEGLAKKPPVTVTSQPISFHKPQEKFNHTRVSPHPQQTSNSRPILGSQNGFPSNGPTSSKPSSVRRSQPPPSSRPSYPQQKYAPKPIKSPPKSGGPPKPQNEFRSESTVNKNIFGQIFQNRLKLTQFRSFFCDSDAKSLPHNMLNLLASCEEFTEVTALKDQIFELNRTYLEHVEKIKTYCGLPDSTWEGIVDLLTHRDALCNELVALTDSYPMKMNEVHTALESFISLLKIKIIRLKECEALFKPSNVAELSEEEIDSRMSTLMEFYTCSPLDTLKSQTDKAEMAVQESYQGLSSVMNNEPGCAVSQYSEKTKNMFPRLIEFGSAIEKELRFYEQPSPDSLDFKYCILISDVLKSIRLKVEKVFKEITSTDDSRDAIRSIGEHCRGALSKEPHPDEAIKAKNKVKSLRSKLRHTLADMADLMESSNVPREDCERYESTAKQLRKEIHQNLITSQEASQSLLKLMEDKPELQIKYKDLNLLEAEKSYRVWDLFYFDFKPVSDQKNIYLSEFNGEDVLIHKVSMPPAAIESKLLKFKQLSELNSLFVPIDVVFRPPAENDVVYVMHRHKPIPEPRVQKIFSDSKVFIRFLQRILSALKLTYQNSFGYINFSFEDLYSEEDVTDHDDEIDMESFANQIRLCPPTDIYALPADFSSIKKTCKDLHTLLLQLGGQLDVDLQAHLSQNLPSYGSILDLTQALSFWQTYYDDIIANEEAEIIRQEILRQEATADKSSEEKFISDPTSIPLPDVDSGDDMLNDSATELVNGDHEDTVEVNRDHEDKGEIIENKANEE